MALSAASTNSSVRLSLEFEAPSTALLITLTDNSAHCSRASEAAAVDASAEMKHTISHLQLGITTLRKRKAGARNVGNFSFRLVGISTLSSSSEDTKFLYRRALFSADFHIR